MRRSLRVPLLAGALLAFAGATAVRSTVLVPVAAADTCYAGQPAGFPDLGAACDYAVFALNGGKSQTGNFSNVTITGAVAVASGATVKNQAPSRVNGDVYVAGGASFTGPGKVTGTVFRNQDLAAARTAAINASAAAATLTPSFTYTNITSGTTVTVTAGGLYVVNISGRINLNHASLTFSGPSDAWFVVNVAGSIILGGTGGIHVGGQVPPWHLLINMTGSGSLLSTKVGNDIRGTLLGPNVGGTLDGLFGRLLLGADFTLMSGARTCKPGYCPDEQYATVGTSAVAMIANLARDQHFVTIINGRPGLKSITVWVDGRKAYWLRLRSGERRRLDVHRQLRSWHTHWIRFRGSGRHGARADVWVSGRR